MQQQNMAVRGLALSLLGPFEITVDGQPAAGQLSDTLRALLSYLAVESGHEHSRAALATLLWPELPEQEALSHLRYAVSNLRAAIGDRTTVPPFLCITRQTIRFNVASNHRLDVAVFLTTKDAPATHPPADLESLEQAIGLYQGDFMAGFASQSAGFEEWVLLRREQFHRQALTVMQHLTDDYLARGNYEKAQHHATRQLELEPWREEAHGQLMRALALNGQRSSAIAQYETCRRLLHQELDIEPGDEITAIHDAIRDGTLCPPNRASTLVLEREIPHRPRPRRDADASMRHDEFLVQVEASLAEQITGVISQQEPASLASVYDSTLEAWTRTVDLRYGHLADHSRQMADLTVWLARSIGVDNRDLIHVRRGALLHDVGIAWIPDSILHKPGPLTEEDWTIVRQHPAFARTLLEPIALLRPALDIPICHHERWDGTGYPLGLRGEELPLVARAFAVIDVWVTLCSDRPYRKAWNKERALQYLVKQAGTQFDPSIVEVFVALLPHAEEDPTHTPGDQLVLPGMPFYPSIMTR